MPRTPSEPASGTVLEDLPFCLARATWSFRRFNDQTLRAVGLGSLAPGLASVVHALEELNDCTVNRLVERTHLPNGTLTGLLDELEQGGYIRRVANPEDGRSWLVGLTDAGRTLCTKLQKRHRLVMGIFRQVLSETESAELTRLLGKVTTGMRHHFREGAPGKSAARTRSPKRQPR